MYIFFSNLMHAVAYFLQTDLKVLNHIIFQVIIKNLAVQCLTTYYEENVLAISTCTLTYPECLRDHFANIKVCDELCSLIEIFWVPQNYRSREAIGCISLLI